MKSRQPRRVENNTRRTLEWFFLAAGLVVGLGVVGGCGAASLAIGGGGSASDYAGLLGGIILLIGLVYLATSMSRDVRLLKQALLEKEAGSYHESQDGDPGSTGGHAS